MSPVYAEPYMYLRSCYDPVPTGTGIQADSTRDIAELHSCRRRQSRPPTAGLNGPEEYCPPYSVPPSYS